MNKIDLLENNYIRFGDFLVHYINQPTKTIWDEAKLFSLLNDEQKALVNLRRQTPDEVILDIEEKYKIEDIKVKLGFKGWYYELWDTGSRGVHIHIRFDNLACEPLEIRNRIRKHIIKEFQTDEKMAKETQWVALESAEHFKTGRPKLLVEGKNQFNHLEQDVIEFCKKEIDIEQITESQTDEDFKDWFKTDPYLNYVLSHKIEDGGRNDVLFKNFAVALVKSGLPKEEIQKVGSAIVINCPGKNIGEFMGWVEKVISGEIKDYNKSEILQWAVQYNHPLLYKMIGEECKDVFTTKMIWDIIWDRRIARQPIWRDLVFYNMMGCIVDETTEDYRIPVIFSCFSGTGKDEGIGLEEEVLKKIGLKTSRPASITDRTLIGAPNQYIEEANAKKKSKDDSDFKDPIETGLLDTYSKQGVHWIAFGEAESVFKPNAFNKQLQIILRQSMDKSRRVEKGVGGRIIKFNTNTSFIFSTYPLQDIITKLLYNGLFQRALYYDKEINNDDHEIILKHINTARFNTNIKSNYDEKEYMALLIEKLKLSKQWYDENKNSIRYFDGADGYIHEKWKAFEDSYKDIMTSDRMVLNSMVRRASNNLNKIMMLYATFNMKSYLTMSDVDECFKIFEICIGSIKNLLGRQDPIKKQHLVLLNILKDESKSTMNVYKELEDNLGIASTTTKNKLIKRLKDLELITDFKDGKFTKLSLTDKGRTQLEDEF